MSICGGIDIIEHPVLAEFADQARGRDTAPNTECTSRQDGGMRQGRLCLPSRLRTR
jgi:hypothetical protein